MFFCPVLFLAATQANLENDLGIFIELVKNYNRKKTRRRVLCCAIQRLWLNQPLLVMFRGCGGVCCSRYCFDVSCRECIDLIICLY